MFSLVNKCLMLSCVVSFVVTVVAMEEGQKSPSLIVSPKARHMRREIISSHGEDCFLFDVPSGIMIKDEEHKDVPTDTIPDRLSKKLSSNEQPKLNITSLAQTEVFFANPFAEAKIEGLLYYHNPDQQKNILKQLNLNMQPGGSLIISALCKNETTERLEGSLKTAWLSLSVLNSLSCKPERRENALRCLLQSIFFKTPLLFLAFLMQQELKSLESHLFLAERKFNEANGNRSSCLNPIADKQTFETMLLKASFDCKNITNQDESYAFDSKKRFGTFLSELIAVLPAFKSMNNDERAEAVSAIISLYTDFDSFNSVIKLPLKVVVAQANK